MTEVIWPAYSVFLFTSCISGSEALLYFPSFDRSLMGHIIHTLPNKSGYYFLQVTIDQNPLILLGNTLLRPCSSP